MPLTIPTLETERLLLRGHRADDLPAYLAMWQQPDFYRFLGGQALPEEEVWTKILRHTGSWELLGYGFWAVEIKATGEFIGAVGFGDWQRTIEPSLKGWPEVGWVLAPHTGGRGYGTEAAQAALAWGDGRFVQPRTVCLIHPNNEPSLRLARRHGYYEFGRIEYKGQPGILLERFATRPEPARI